MKAKERQAMILAQLESEGIVSLKEASAKLNASTCTIRRDFEKLEQENKCRRIHGGILRALSEEPLQETTNISMDIRMHLQADAKKQLCTACAALIQDHDCIFVDGGTTFLSLLDLLHEKPVTIVTHSHLLHAKMDASYTFITLGGQVNPFYQMSLGPLTLKNLETFHFDKAFIGCAGIDLETNHVYTAEIDTAQIKEAAISHAKQKYLVADKSKIGIVGFYRFASLDDFHGLIIDQKSDVMETSIKIIEAEGEL